MSHLWSSDSAWTGSVVMVPPQAFRSVATVI